jgi:histidinol-phosphate aminotransferase
MENLEIYVPGEQPQDVDQWIKLNTNENAFEPPHEFVQDFIAQLPNKLRLYPDPQCKQLRKVMAEDYFAKKYGSSPDPNTIVCGVGSDEILDIIFKAFVNPGDSIISFSPSYGMYEVLAKTYLADFKLIPMNADFTLPDIEKVPAEGKILIICSPNNPTGISVSNDYIIKICEKFQGLVIVDEAYADFSLISAMPLISRFNNLIVLRTVSKSFSLASVRLGFSQSSVEIANYMNSIRLPINISYPSQLAGILAIKHLDAFEKQMEIIINERRKVSEALKKIGLEIIESESNFVLISFGTEEKAKLAFQKLKDKKILLRHYKQPGAEPYLRMTIGKPEQNDIVIKAISEIAKNL